MKNEYIPFPLENIDFLGVMRFPNSIFIPEVSWLDDSEVLVFKLRIKHPEATEYLLDFEETLPDQGMIYFLNSARARVSLVNFLDRTISVQGVFVRAVSRSISENGKLSIEPNHYEEDELDFTLTLGDIVITTRCKKHRVAKFLMVEEFNFIP
ncbi:MAG: hypothetical protein AAB432_00250 [Patescibacteria group bacterium]